MNVSQGTGGLPFFLPAAPGERFCLYHPANPALPPRGAVLYVHPFAEELNKSRRMAALQARAYAQAGFQVLQIDLYGCGDSSGDFADARWDIWRADLILAWDWLQQRGAGPFYLWGLRLGALLALELAGQLQADALILWQPVISGRGHLNQFLRMQSAARLFGAAGPAADDGLDLAAGVAETAKTAEIAEVAGYALAPALTDAIRHADGSMHAPRCPVHWLELSAPLGPDAASATPALQAASVLTVQRWREAGGLVHTHAVRGLPFWNSTEIVESPALISATLGATIAVSAAAAATTPVDPSAGNAARAVTPRQPA